MAESPGKTLGHDLICVSCGYNLRGLPVNGQCPECGATILQSVAATVGETLGDADWARRVARGARLYAIAMLSPLLVVVTMVVLAYLGFGNDAERVIGLAFVGCIDAAAAAVWLSTRPVDPDWGWQIWKWPRVLRIIAALTAAAATMACLLLLIGNDNDWVFCVAAVVGMLITDALYMLYLAALVHHLPGHLARWGYVTAGRIPLLLLTLGWISIEGARQGSLEAIVQGALSLVVPAVALLWPAIYAWVWSRRVGKLAGR